MVNFHPLISLLLLLLISFSLITQLRMLAFLLPFIYVHEFHNNNIHSMKLEIQIKMGLYFFDIITKYQNMTHIYIIVLYFHLSKRKQANVQTPTK